jgi:hypothetical protein
LRAPTFVVVTTGTRVAAFVIVVRVVRVVILIAIASASAIAIIAIPILILILILILIVVIFIVIITARRSAVVSALPLADVQRHAGGRRTAVADVVRRVAVGQRVVDGDAHSTILQLNETVLLAVAAAFRRVNVAHQMRHMEERVSKTRAVAERPVARAFTAPVHRALSRQKAIIAES